MKKPIPQENIIIPRYANIVSPTPKITPINRITNMINIGNITNNRTVLKSIKTKGKYILKNFSNLNSQTPTIPPRFFDA